MGLFSYLIHNKEAKELEEVIISSWERLNTFFQKNIRLDECYRLDSYYEQIKMKAIIEGDGLQLGSVFSAVRFNLVATKNNFDSLYSMCAELVANINKYYKLCEKMEIGISQKVSDISMNYQSYMIKLKYCEKYVVE